MRVLRFNEINQLKPVTNWVSVEQAERRFKSVASLSACLNFYLLILSAGIGVTAYTFKDQKSLIRSNQRGYGFCYAI